MFLHDEQIHQLLDPPSTVIEGLDPGRVPDSKDEPVQPASVDLTIGGIYVPGTKDGKLGSAGNPLESLPLGRGETAVVETTQTCNLPPNIGAIGFPPASVSAKGLLTTNPGYIDPGYRGKLSFTVINMGREAYPLNKGAEIVSLLLFRLSADARAPYDVRRGAGPHGVVTNERLGKLSHDFLDVSARVQEAADRSERRTRLLGMGVPIIVAIVAAGGVFFQASRANNDEIQRLQQDVKVLQTKLDLEKRVADLEAQK